MTADPYRDGIHIAAEPEVDFDDFTNATALARWMGDRAVVDPRPGGRFTIFFAGRRVEGRYLEVDRPRRLVISWGRAGSQSFSPGTSVLEVTLTAHDGGTPRGVAGFIETQQGIRFLQQVLTHDAAAVLYDADLPGGTLRFAEFFRFDGGQIASIKLLYDPGRYTEFGGR